MFHDTEKWRKIWGDTDMQLGKLHEKFGKFLPEHSTVSQVGLWWDSFIQSRKFMSLELTEELDIITTRNYAKYKEWLTSYFKSDTTIWQILIWALEHLKNLDFKGFLLTRVYDVRAKKVQKSYNGSENWSKIWMKPDLWIVLDLQNRCP